MSQSLKKGIEALLFLASRKSVGVTELAEALEVHKSTAFRILDTLQEANMVEKSKETLKYRLGPTILQLSEQYYRNFSIVAVARPIMERLVSEIRESVHLGVLVNNSAVIIEQILSDSRLVVNAKVGGSEPLHCSSVGKCLLAFAPEEQRGKMLKSICFDAYTDKTITSIARLQEELEKVRRLGYAVDDEELSPNIKCAAVPLMNRQGACVYSLGASGVASRMTDEKMEKLIPLMLRAAAEINTHLKTGIGV